MEKQKMTFIAVCVVLLLTLMNTCNSCSTRREIVKLSTVQDSLRRELNEIKTFNSTISKTIQIEGLKGEKRMIQSTDRKLWDLNRQSVIDKEIDKLNK